MDSSTLELLRSGGSVAPPDDATRAAREIQLAQGNPLPAVTKTPDEEAQITSEVNAPTNLAAIDAEIARTAHPIGRAVLQEERARVVAAQPPQTTPKPPPTWDEVTKLPEIQALPFDQREGARNQYFLDVVAPQIPTEHLDAARAAFEADTKPGLLNEAIDRLSTVVRIPKQQSAQPPNPQLQDAGTLERPARMTLTPQGQPRYAEAEQPQAQTGLEEPSPVEPKFSENRFVKDWAVPFITHRPPGGIFPRQGDEANRRSREMVEAERAGGSSGELAQRAREKAWRDLYATDFWRNVATSIQNVPADYKQVMGGFLQSLGESMDAEPEAPRVRAFGKSMANMGADFYEQGDTEIQKNTQGMKPGLGAETVGSTILSVTRMAPALAAGMLTKNPATVIGIMSGETGASSYSQARAQGLDRGDAAKYALIQGLVEGGTEYLPVKALLAKGPLSASKRFYNVVAREVPGEDVATFLQDAADKAYLKPDMTLEDLLHDLVVTTLSTPIAAGAQVAAVHAAAGAAREPAAAAAPVPAAREAPAVDLPTVGELLGGEPVPKSAEARPIPQERAPESAEAAARIAEINGQLGMVATSLSKAREDGNQDQVDHYEARAKELIGERAGLEKQANPDIATEDLQRQNRDRTRAASVAQVQSIANKPDYDRLATAPIPDVGAPMVSVKGDTEAISATDMGKASVVTLGDGTKVPVRYAVIEAGSVLASNDVNGKRNAEYFGNDIPQGQVVAMTNGRVAGLQGAYARDTAAPYKAGMLADPEHGVSAEAINGKKNPMLVRVYPDSYNALPRLAQLSNTGGSAQLSDTEKARGDAAALDSLDGFVPTESGDVTGAANMPFVRRFMQSIPENERPEMMTATGELSQAGVKRLRAAVFAKAYGGGEVLARMIESSDDNVRSITAGLMRAAPAVARLREKVAAGALHDLDITPALLAAIEDISRLRDSGTSVGAWIAQADMFGALPREVGDLMQFLEDNARSGRRIADFLERYLAAAEAIGSPQQAGMFEQKVPSKADVVRGVTKEMANERQTGLPQGAQPAAADAGTTARGAAETGAEPVPGPLEPVQPGQKREGGARAEVGTGLTVEQRKGKWWVSDTAGELAEFDTEAQARRFAASMEQRTPTVDVMQQAIDKVGEARFQELVAQHMEQFAGQKLDPADEAHQVEAVARGIIGNVDPLKEELDQALSDLGGWVEANLLPKAAMLPDNADENLLPILSRLFTVAIKKGYRDFASASKFVMGEIRKKAAELSKLLNDALLRKAFDHATQTGKQPEGNQPEHLGVPPGSNLREDQGQVREEKGGQASRGGGAVERAQADADRVVQPRSDGGEGDQVRTGAAESSVSGIPSSAARAGERVGESSISPNVNLAGVHDLEAASQRSPLLEPSGSVTPRTTPMSESAGPRKTFTLGSIDATSKRIITQSIADVPELLRRAAAAKSELDDIIGQVAKEVDAEAVAARVKEDAPRLANKLKKIPAQTLSDYLGARLVVPTRKAMNAARSLLLERFAGFHDEDFTTNPRFTGYRALHVQVPVGEGISAEVQIVPAQVAKVQDDAHVFYSEVRDLDISEWSPAQRAKNVALKQRFTDAWNNFAAGQRLPKSGKIESEKTSGQQPAQRPESAQARDRQGAARPAAASPADRGQMGLGFADEGEGAGGERQAARRPEGAVKPGGEGARGREDERSVQRRAGSRDTGDERDQPASELKVAQNYAITAKDDLGGGGDKTKTRNNLAAIRLLKQLTAEKRPATPEEQAALVKYVGWGGLKSVFDERNADTANDRSALKELLTPSEFEAARRSVLDSHYTSETVINGIYQGLARLGFSGGRVLEPGVGIGHFFGLMPSSVAEASQLFGVELDPVTGGIARLLYPRADIKAPRGFQEVNIPAEYFDAAIGNPPFGNQPIADETGAEIPKLSIHNFFFAKALHSLRPGGVLAMVTSHYFLDANNSAARTWIAKRAELVGAIRLPNTAFLKNAGTEVTTDIVFLRKLKAGEKAEASWTKVGSIKDEATGEPIAISPYFIEHPEMMLGKMTLAGTMYGGKLEATLEARPGEDLAKALENAVATLPQGIFQAAPKTVAELAPADVIVPDTVKVGGIFVLPDSRLAQRAPDVMDKPQHSIYQAPNDRAIARIKGMIGVRDAVRTLMHAEMADESPERLARLRAKLNVVYDEFKAKHGFINSLGNRRAFQDDPDLPLLEALERHYDPGVSKDVAKRSGETPRAPSAEKATIFTKRVISPAQIITKADSAGDALSASLSERGKVDLPYMEQLYGRPTEDILKELAGVVFNDPKAGYVTADEYLSGNVKKKLAEAREAVKRDPRMATNVEALERVQPKDIQAVDISVRLGSPWVPAKDVGDFIESLLGERPASISYQASVASWLLDLPERSTSAFTTTWGAKTKAHESWGAGRIIGATLNSKPILVRRNIGTKEAPNWIVLEAETDAARAKGEAIAAKFREWIFQDQSRRDRLARMYNDKFNTDRTREFNGSHLTLPGANPSITLTPNKKHSVWRMIQSKSTLLDHVVGSGKTYTIAAAMMEKRRLGISRKPMVVVPNHIVRQWRDSWYALYPNANLLAATEEDFERGNRQRLFARIATGDWDAVIVAHSAFSKIAMPKAERDAVFREQINDISAAIAELKAKKGESYTVRQLERSKLALEDKLKAAEAKTRGKDQFIDFSELGVDDLAVDESQEFKNLFYTSQMRNVTGMGNPEGSGKAFDMFVKTRYLRKRNGKITFATGTPMSNSLVEMFSIQRYLDYDTMRENGLSHLDAWAGTYADIQNVWEVHPSGNGYRLATRFAQFVNLPELVTQYKKFADIITQQDMIDQAKAQGNRYPIPKVKTGKPIMHIAKRSPQQAAFMGVPEFLRDEDGKIQFKRAMNDGQVMSRKDWVNVFSLGEEKDTERWPLDSPEYAIVGEGQHPEDFFTSREDGQAALDAQRNEPKVVYPEGSILWKFENLRELMRESEGKINALSITNEARKAGLDFRIIDPKAMDFTGSKVNDAADTITEIHKEWKDDRGTQLVFIDLSTPKGTAKAAPVLDPTDGETVINMDEVMAKASGYSVYDSLREKLIGRGIPAREIAFIHDAHTQEQKRKLFAKVNRGEIRVLMGSSFKMGAGTNVQERMVAIHHIDVPWRPSDLEQRDGRGIRQGNDLYMLDPDGFEFQLHRYATEKTYDTRMWQIVQHKASGFEQFRKGAMGARKMEDIGGEASNSADMKAAASGNPLIAEEIKLRDRLKKLGNIFDAWRSGRYELENDIERWKKWPSVVAGKVKELERLIDQREPKPEEGFTLTLADGKKITDAEGIATPLVAAMKEAMKIDGAEIPIGKYRGFYLSDIYHAWGKAHVIVASTSNKPGATVDRVTEYGEHDQFSPSGFLSRVDNYLAGFEKEIANENASAAKSREELKKAEAELAKPFEQQQEMETTRSKLQEVQAALLKSGGSIEMSPEMRKELAAAIKERGGTPPEDTALSRMGELRHGLAGMAQVDVNAVVDIYRKGFKGLPPVHVLESVKQAPAELRGDIKRLGGENDTAGAWHNGEVYLFSDNINSPMHAEWVILHENTHHGLRGMLGGNLKPLLMNIYMQNAQVRHAAEDQRRRNPNLSVIAATEEVLANMGADGVPQGIMQRIVAAVRKFLRQIGFKLQLSDSDIQGLVAQALRFVKEKPGQTHLLSGTALAAGQPPGAQGTLGLAPASRGLIGHYVSVANKVIDFTDRLSNPLVDLPGQADYLGHRQITMGIIDRGNDIVKMIKAVFKDSTPEQRRAASDYFLTAGARPPATLGGMRIGVENIKKLINEMSDKLVSSGVISAEAREEFRDRYLPQLYLRWLLEDKHWKTIGGKKASDLGYTKERKLTQFRDERGELKLKEKGTGRVLSDAEVLSLGPVTDPAFLASVAIARSLRDMAILDWLGKISQDSRWVLPNSIITWNGKRVSPYFVKEEATRLRRQAEHYQPEDARRTREYADRMDAAADRAIAGMPESRDGYLQIPKAARYGALRGIWVREEIYHDLMGSSSDMSNDPNWFKDWFGTGGKGETVTRWWKATKTILNLPGQLRNIATNFSQLQLDGIGFHKMPVVLTKAVSQMRSNGPYYKEFKQQGGRGGTFSNQELGRMERDLLDLQAKAGALNTMQTIHRMAAIVYNAAGDAWQAVEVLGKMMAFVDSRDAGAAPSKAMARANKVLFDYSLVPSWVRYARRVPFGIAFATWNAKVLPRMVETALKHPHRFLPYAIFYYGAQFALAAMLGVGYDDLDRLKKAMPEWLANKRHAVLMPWKDEHGRWEVVDLGYIMPWTNWLQLATDAATGKVTNVMQDIGAFSGPIPNVIAAISTSQDPFTHRDIANKGDPPARQAASWLNYAWSMAVPPFLSDTGALGHGIRAYTGQTNKYGDPLDTPTQAALRAFGINRYPLEPEQARAANIRKQEFEIQEVKHAAKMRLMDRAMSPEKRDALIEEYRTEAQRRQEKLVRYIAESGIHPALQTGR